MEESELSVASLAAELAAMRGAVLTATEQAQRASAAVKAMKREYINVVDGLRNGSSSLLAERLATFERFIIERVQDEMAKGGVASASSSACASSSAAASTSQVVARLEKIEARMASMTERIDALAESLQHRKGAEFEPLRALLVQLQTEQDGSREYVEVEMEHSRHLMQALTEKTIAVAERVQSLELHTSSSVSGALLPTNSAEELLARLGRVEGKVVVQDRRLQSAECGLAGEKVALTTAMTRAAKQSGIKLAHLKEQLEAALEVVREEHRKLATRVVQAEKKVSGSSLTTRKAAVGQRREVFRTVAALLEERSKNLLRRRFFSAWLSWRTHCDHLQRDRTVLMLFTKHKRMIDALVEHIQGGSLAA